jgi:hypothetical protein
MSVARAAARPVEDDRPRLVTTVIHGPHSSTVIPAAYGLTKSSK